MIRTHPIRFRIAIRRIRSATAESAARSCRGNRFPRGRRAREGQTRTPRPTHAANRPSPPRNAAAQRAARARVAPRARPPRQGATAPRSDRSRPRYSRNDECCFLARTRRRRPPASLLLLLILLLLLPSLPPTAAARAFVERRGSPRTTPRDRPPRVVRRPEARGPRLRGRDADAHRHPPGERARGPPHRLRPRLRHQVRGERVRAARPAGGDGQRVHRAARAHGERHGRRRRARGRDGVRAVLGRVHSIITLVPVRPRSRGARRSLRTLLPGASLLSSLAFNPRPRRLSTSTDAFQLHPDVALYGPSTLIS